MTIKGKRAPSLRKMDDQEASSFCMGGMVDETFPVAAVRLAIEPIIESVDMPAFYAFFGQRLGLYRAMSESQKDQPSVAKELEIVGETMEYVQQLRLRLEHLPPQTDAHANTISWNRRGELFDDFRRRLDDDLKEALTLLALTELALKPSKGKAGRKTASLRDWFLHDVANQLQAASLGAEQVAGVAAAVLRAVGIDAPADPREARKLILATEKLAGKN